MAPFWKGRPKFLRFGKKKKDKGQVEDVDVGYVEQLPIDYAEVPHITVAEHGLSPESGDSWRDFPRQTEEQMRAQEVHVYAGPDDYPDDLARYEVERSPHSQLYEIARTPEGYEHAPERGSKSFRSLSTVTPTMRGRDASVVATAEEIDVLVRQSMASRGQPISVAMLDPVDVPPVPRIPEHLERSRTEHSASLHEFGIPPIFEPPQAESRFTGEDGIALVESPISYATPLPAPPPPISSSAHTAPRSSIRSVPNRFRGPYSEKSEHIDLPEPSRSSHPITPVNTVPPPRTPIQSVTPQALTPMQNVIQEPLLPQEEHRPETIVLEDTVEDVRVFRSSTGKSTVPTIRSKTYQRALNMPTRIPDPMGRYLPSAPPLPRYIPKPYLPPPPAPRLPSVHRSIISSIRVEESRGNSLVEARRALYGSHRKASKRFFWNLSPQHDPRVMQGLARLERIPDSIASLGFVKFLETRSRGALLVNLGYIAESEEEFPTADWITFAQAQKTYDYTLQESIAKYDPAVKTLVFAFLLSRTKNSLAIWRRQFPVPERTREAYGSLLDEVKSEWADKEILVHIEATPKRPHGTRSDIGLQPPPRTGPLIFNYPIPEERTPEQVELLPMPNVQTATITGTTVHEFGPQGRRKSTAVHVFGRTPSNRTLTPLGEEEEVDVVTVVPKKKPWFKRVFGGKPKSKTMDETVVRRRSRGALRKDPRRKGNTLTHVEWD